MIYGLANLTQFTPLLHSLLLGVCSGIVWDVFRFVRRIKPPGRIALFLEDVLFFVIWSLMTFLLCYIYNFGIIRAYILLAQPFGFLLWYCLPGKITFFLADHFAAFFVHRVIRPFCAVFCRMYRIFYRGAQGLSRKRQKNEKKMKKNNKNIPKLKKKTCKKNNLNV